MRITQMLDRAVDDTNDGKTEPLHLYKILQDAIDNGDIIEPQNVDCVELMILPLVEKGILKTSPYLEDWKVDQVNTESQRIPFFVKAIVFGGSILLIVGAVLYFGAVSQIIIAAAVVFWGYVLTVWIWRMLTVLPFESALASSSTTQRVLQYLVAFAAAVGVGYLAGEYFLIAFAAVITPLWVSLYSGHKVRA